MQIITITVKKWSGSLVFAFVFLVLHTIFDLLYGKMSEAELRPVYLDVIVKISTWIINGISPDNKAFAYENTLLSSKAAFKIERTCSGTLPFFFACGSDIGCYGAG